jgi:hypothetical protein
MVALTQQSGKVFRRFTLTDMIHAHGQGKRPVKPLPRDAELAVNMTGSMASFLLATFEAKKSRE